MHAQMKLLKRLSAYSLLPLLMVILLDVMGIVLVLPILTPLIFSPDSNLIMTNTPEFERDFYYGLSLALYPLFMFFSTPILGDLSDRFGRKRILLVCLVGSALSYVVAALAIYLGSLITLLISRIVGGLVAGTQPIATAAIVTISTSQTKTHNLALVVFMSSIGLIIGPLLGGLAAEKNLISWFGYEVPFIFSSLICVLNAILLYFFLNETQITDIKHKILLSKGFTLFLTAFVHKKFRLLSLIFFCFALAWGLYYQTINWVFAANYHYGAGKLGLFSGYIGLIFAFTSSILVRRIIHLFSHEPDAFMFFIYLMGIANIGAAITPQELGQWLWAILNAGSEVICFTIVLSIFSHLVDEKSQGWIMGVTSAIGAITWTIAGLITGLLGYINIRMPLWIAGTLCFISFFAMLFYRRFYITHQVNIKTNTILNLN